MPKEKQESVDSFRKFLHTLKFLFRERRAFLYIVVSIILCTMIGSGVATHWDQWQYWDSALTLFTVTIGLVVYFSEAMEHWESRLPKRLTVYFLVNGITRMVCRQAHLSHEGDIRGWSQQIGSQISGIRDLKLIPTLDIVSLGVQKLDGAAEHVNHYQATLYLKELPETLAKDLTDHGDKDEKPLCKVLPPAPQANEFLYEPAEKYRPAQLR